MNDKCKTGHAVFYTRSSLPGSIITEIVPWYIHPATAASNESCIAKKQKTKKQKKNKNK